MTTLETATSCGPKSDPAGRTIRRRTCPPHGSGAAAPVTSVTSPGRPDRRSAREGVDLVPAPTLAPPGSESGSATVAEARTWRARPPHPLPGRSADPPATTTKLRPALWRKTASRVSSAEPGLDLDRTGRGTDDEREDGLDRQAGAARHEAGDLCRIACAAGQCPPIEAGPETQGSLVVSAGPATPATDPALSTLQRRVPPRRRSEKRPQRQPGPRDGGARYHASSDTPIRRRHDGNLARVRSNGGTPRGACTARSGRCQYDRSAHLALNWGNS